ncbi:MAG: hypothetical protein HY815_05810 [Candidatus Riflebacteria bacterium]|nr:hypothetical protein [Candidatus Riflebacteria bacterium]
MQRRSWDFLGGAVLVGMATLMVLGSYQFSTRALLGHDSHYHVAAARSFLTDGLQRNGLRWLPLTRVQDKWVDHEYGWHLLALPFLSGNPIAGAKAFTVLQGLALVLTLYLIARRWNAPLGGFLALVAVAGSGAMLSRVSAFRPQTLAVVLLLWGLWAIVERRPRALVVLTFAFTAIHIGFFILVLAGVGASILRTGLAWLGHDEEDAPGRWAEALAVLAGAFLGLVVNPYFPATIQSFVWHLGLPSLGAAPGLEGTPFSTWDLIELNLTVVAVLALTVCIAEARSAFPSSRAIRSDTLLLFFAFLALFLAGLRHRQWVDWWVPVGLLWAGLSLRDILGSDLSHVMPRRQLVIGVALGVAVGFSFVEYRQRASPGEEESFDRFRRLASHMEEKERPPRGERIYHSSWTHFPQLVHAAPACSYISGLDPELLASRRPELAALMEGLGRGAVAAPSLPIRIAFGARYVLVDTERDQGLNSQAQRDPLLETVLEERGLSLYRLRAAPALPLELNGSWLVAGAQTQGGRVFDDGCLVFTTGLSGALLDLPLPLPQPGQTRVSIQAEATPPGATFNVSLNRETVARAVTTREMEGGLDLPMLGRGLARLVLTLTGQTQGPVTLRLTRVRLEGR